MRDVPASQGTTVNRMMGPVLVALVASYVVSRLIYWFVIDREVPGGWERRFGVEEDLPDDVGRWRVDDESEEGKAAATRGLKREVRVFHDVRTGRLTHQARCRNAATNEIASVEPDRPVRRARQRT